MKVDELIPAPKLRVHFALSSHVRVPEAPGCYVLATSEDQILYVGLTGNLVERFRAHCECEEKRDLTTIGRAFFFYYMIVEPKELNRVERTWQNEYMAMHGDLPVLNKVLSPVR
jgi:excinuclease UvrABC nuclease subunit